MQAGKSQCLRVLRRPNQLVLAVASVPSSAKPEVLIDEQVFEKSPDPAPR